MASNPNVNKVVYGNDTLIDLTADTVTADKILQGYTAHDKSGAGITGTYVAPATPTNITPSNTTPPALSIDVPVNPKGTGYAIQSYSNVTPTSSGAYFSSGFKKMSSSGYAYSQQPPKTKTGTFSGVSTTYKLNLGFKPKQICIYRQDMGWMMSYDENYSTTQFYRATSGGAGIVNLGATSTSNYNIQSIDDDGVTIIFRDSTYANFSWNYYAIG